jgi:hypothetical protein
MSLLTVEPRLTTKRRHSWFTRFLARLSRRYWVSRIDLVLSEAKEAGLLSNWTLHELDHRMKYDPLRRHDNYLNRVPAAKAMASGETRL